MNTYQNPFITSAEVYAENDFFDREEVLREIEKFIEREKDYNFLLSGQRRIGKTSVLKKIEKLHNNNNSKAIYITLQAEGETDLNDLLNKIAQRIAKELDFEFKIIINENSFISEFLPLLKKNLKNRKLILLFDEFDVLGELESIREFKKTFSYHRFIPYCAAIIEKLKQNNIPLKIVFAIGRNYKDLDTARFGQITKFGQQIEIGYFSNEIVKQLLAQADNILPISDDAKQKIFEITGGQPYFTQCLAHIAFDLALDKNLQNINLQTVEESLPIAIKRYSNGVIWIWDTLTPKDKIVLYIAALLQESKDDICGENIKVRAANLAVLPACDKLYDTLNRLNNIKFLKNVNKEKYSFYVEFFRKWIVTEIATEEIQKVFAKIDVEIDAMLTNARFYYNEKNYKEAEKLYAEIINYRPQHYEALFYYAKCKHLQNNKTSENYKEIFENYYNAHKLKPAYKSNEFLNFLYEYFSFSKKQKIENQEIILLINKLNPNDIEINKLVGLESIKQLEKELNTKFKKVDISEIIIYRWEKTAEYSSNPNGVVTGLSIVRFGLTEIPQTLTKYRTLTNLNLGYNKIADISALKELKSLTELNLNDNQITDISALKELKNLTELDLRFNKITDISVLASLSKFKTLTSLYK
ncbi:MAG: AAA family ATPase [Bacteroidetes bacterium]|jgi:hypothetical protein|nr:AAA family ATPase [Bacteroidota bacterium]MBT6684757.1 AAA family ATPase [Bacteroidota bacterium]MBT7143343.1 AAA family ATPase [Bacteroidota bacterium]MBT7493181.1 AAA family ATPase [Bacteroidota bacterium]